MPYGTCIAAITEASVGVELSGSAIDGRAEMRSLERIALCLPGVLAMTCVAGYEAPEDSDIKFRMPPDTVGPPTSGGPPGTGGPPDGGGPPGTGGLPEAVARRITTATRRFLYGESWDARLR